MPDDERAQEAREAFARTFGARAEGVATAPGRVNLIGEHTDYNDGFVLPMAIDRGVAIAFRPRSDRTVRARSTLTGNTQSVDLDSLRPGHRDWISYVAGVAWAMAEADRPVGGADLLIHGDLPAGAGLASSAALEVATVLALGGKAAQQTPREIVATMAHRAESRFVGVACGMMDQMASACSREDHALFLDCRSLNIDTVPIPDNVAIVVMDTGVRRKLAGSEYNDCRSACERAVVVLNREYGGVRALRDVTLEEVLAVRDQFSGSDGNRALHVVTENQRVLGAFDALQQGDLETFGGLINASHTSLRDLYEVSSPVLDTAVDCARAHYACIGARLTGAGFGGCAIAVVAADAAASFVSDVRPLLRDRIGHAADAFMCRASAGASVLFDG